MASRRNSAVKIYVNGRVADDLYGLSKRIGAQVSRMSTAARRAQSSLSRKVQPVATRVVRTAYNIKATDLRARLKLATGLRAKGDFISLQASTRRISLIAFGGQWGGRTTAGATASILLGQRKTYSEAFIASVGWRGTSGRAVKTDTVSRNIYVRSRGPDGKRVGRGPLKRLYGPSAFEMLVPSPVGGSSGAAGKVRAAILDELHGFYVSELSRQIALELRRG
jgi:hypothetical protein